MGARLSVLVVVDTPTPPAWINQLLTRLDKHPLLELTLLVAGNNRPANSVAAEAGPLAQLAARWLLARIDKPRFTAEPKAAQALSIDPGHSALDAMPAVQGCKVILNLTQSPIPESWPVAAEAVEWSAQTQTLDERVKESLLARAPLVWVHLWSKPCTDEHYELLASHSLPRQSFSLSDLQRAAWSCLPALFESRLNWLASGEDPLAMEGSERQCGKAALDTDRQAARQQARQLASEHFAPKGNNGLVNIIALLQLWYFQTKLRIRHGLYYEQWQLGIIKRPDHSAGKIASLKSFSPDDYITIEPPARTWWADPHLAQRGDETFVFFEEMTIDGTHGHLSVARLDDKGQTRSVTRILDDGEHLSYPFVFSHQGQDYMIPETASRRTVSLYQSTRFPEHWTKHSDLMNDVDLADSTLCFVDGQWWMFTNSMTHRCIDERDELRLFHAKDLTGPWLPHPLNPVVTGVDRARMAGALIQDGDTVYRVSQYGAHRYGYGINIHRIDTLNEQCYREVLVHRILPDDSGKWLGCHTISHLDGTTVLDRVTWRRRH